MICILSILVIWAMTRQWWLATLPLVALNLHIGVHIVTSTLIARDRPSVQQLDVRAHRQLPERPHGCDDRSSW